jgi:amidase
MTFRGPSENDIKRMAERFGFQFSDTELTEMHEYLRAGVEASYSRVDQLIDPKLVVQYPRSVGKRPEAKDNKYGAWNWQGTIKGSDVGILKGKTIVVKDNICVAGMPLNNGTDLLDGYVSDVDATVVSRVLDHGATLLGKTVCENLCFSGSSHTSDSGPVRNPYDLSRSSGGSSSGSAVLVSLGEVDMALGGDQGGSIRGPSSWCGIVGLKPTHGLVPYTGIFSVEPTIDHVGPIGRTTQDVALLLEAIVGMDGLDPRQSSLMSETMNYTAHLTGDISDVTVGIVQEGFGWDVSEDDVDIAVRNAANQFNQLGAKVHELSIPMHRDAMHIWAPIAVEGSYVHMMEGNGLGVGWKGFYNTSLLKAFNDSWHQSADRLPITVKQMMLMGSYMRASYGGYYYGKAQNLVRVLQKSYDDALETCDVLIMPTMPMKPRLLSSNSNTMTDYLTRAFEMNPNNCAFNATGHPAISVPCAMSEGLPIGMMIIGKKGDEKTVLRVANAFETNIFQAPRPRQLD